MHKANSIFDFLSINIIQQYKHEIQSIDWIGDCQCN